MSSFLNEVDPTMALRASKIGFRYRADLPWVLRDISLTLESSKFLCLVGVNGSGKTTLARLLIGELDPTEGKLLLGSGTKACIRYQNYDKNLLPWYSAQRNIDLLSAKNRHADLHRLLDIADFDSWRLTRVSNLSGGQRQLLSVYTTLLLSFNVLVLDEPFNAIDPTKLVELWQLIRRWCKQNSITALVITHNIDEAVALGDTVVVLMDASRGDLRSFPISRRDGTDNILDTKEAHSYRKRILDTIYGLV